MEIRTGLVPKLRNGTRIMPNGESKPTKVIEFRHADGDLSHVLQVAPGTEVGLFRPNGFVMVMPDGFEKMNGARWAYEAKRLGMPDDAVVTEERDEHRELTTRTAMWYEVTL